MKLEPELISKLVVIVAVLFLLLMYKNLWDMWDNLLESNEELHPDGLNKCPPETYTLKTRDKARCISCPQCSTGMEPTPPCGTTLAVRLTGECLPCRAGTFSQEAGTTACKECTDCGSREVLSSCMAERDSECKDCPWSYYQDQRTRLCKHCSSCCLWNTPAFLECITSKVCKGNCSQTTKFKRKYTHSLLKRSFTKSTNSSREAFSASTFNSEKKDRQERSAGELNRLISGNEESNRTELIKRDIILPFESHMDDKDSTTTSDSLINENLDGREIEDLQLIKLHDLSNTVDVQTGNLRMEKKKTHPSGEYPEFFNTNTFVKEEQSIPSTNPSILLPPTGSGPLLREFKPTRQVPVHMSAASTSGIQQRPLMNTTLFVSSFAGTITAGVVLGVIAVIVYVLRRKCTVHKYFNGYKKLSGTISRGEQQSRDDDPLDETLTDAENETAANEVTSGICNTGTDATRILQDLNLAEIPPDLEDILVQELDIRQTTGKYEVYRWQKVGREAGIPQRELKYLETEYDRPYGSPTKLLLDKLGSQGRTISYLIDVLQTPKVQLGSVAASIRHRVTRI